MKKILLALLLGAMPLCAQIPSPGYPVSGMVGATNGSPTLPTLLTGTLVLSADADHTLAYPETVAQSFTVTSTVSLTAQRNLVGPLIRGTYTVENSTTGGQNIELVGSTGTGVVIPNGGTKSIYCDGTNYIDVTASAISGAVVTNSVATNSVNVQNAAAFPPAAAVTSPTFATGTQESHTSPGDPVADAPVIYNSVYTFLGPGWTYGPSSGNPQWWSAADHYLTSNVYKEGIFHSLTINAYNWHTGDNAGIYIYNHSDGGATAEADEGSSGVTVQQYQDPIWTGYAASSGVPTVLSTGNQVLPAVNTTRVAPSAGGIMLRIASCTDSTHTNCSSASTYTGTISGVPNSGSHDTINFSNGTHSWKLSYIPVSGVILPKLTSWGTSTVGLGATGKVAGYYSSATLTITLGAGMSAFSDGFGVIAGPDNAETTSITAGTLSIDGTTQSVTFTYSKPHPNGVILTQDGISPAGALAGQYLMPDMDNPYHVQAYLIAGSLSGSEVLTAVNVNGYSTANLSIWPTHDEPVYCAITGTCSGGTTAFHIYQGAEVAAVDRYVTSNFDPMLYYNNVPWASNDQLTNAQQPSWGGDAMWLVYQHDAPHYGDGTAALHIDAKGQGYSDPMLLLRNMNPNSLYIPAGGVIPDPPLISATGLFGDFADMGYAPPYNGCVFCFNGWQTTPVSSDASKYIDLFSFPYSAGAILGGGLRYYPWSGNFDMRQGALVGVANINSGGIQAPGVSSIGNVLTSHLNTLDDGYGNIHASYGLSVGTPGLSYTGNISATSLAGSSTNSLCATSAGLLTISGCSGYLGNAFVPLQTSSRYIYLGSSTTAGQPGIVVDPAIQTMFGLFGDGGNLTLQASSDDTGGSIFFGGSARGDSSRGASYFNYNGSPVFIVDGNYTGHNPGFAYFGTSRTGGSWSGVPARLTVGSSDQFQVTDAGLMTTANATITSLTTAGVVTNTSSGVLGTTPLAGSGAGVTTGPASGTTAGNLVSYASTNGQTLDSGIPASGVFNTTGAGLSSSGNTVSSNAVYEISFQPGTLTAVTSTIGVFSKVSKASTVDNIVGSAYLFSCTTNPTITLYECGTSASCASPVTIGTVTVTAAGTAVNGTVSSSAITAGDYVGWAITSGSCTSLNISANAQVHSN